MSEAKTVYLALGSNLGDKEKILNEVRDLIGKRVGRVLSESSLLQTEPVGFASSHLFLNQVISVETFLSPKDLLGVLLEIEREQGRFQKSEDGIYQDRTCDIDIIFYEGVVLDVKELKIPHPKYHERLFVLEPLVEIAPDLKDPLRNKTMKELLWDVLSH